MLMTAVIQPEAFDQVHFATPGYRDQAEMLFRGFQSNGLAILDPNSRLLKEIEDRITLLSTKDGQQLQIRLEELCKNNRRRLITLERASCPCNTTLSLFDTATTVHTHSKADTIIVDTTSLNRLAALNYLPNSFTSLNSYITSDYERQRHEYYDSLPPIDEMKPGEFDAHIVRVTRFTKTLRFYDKQIGKGDSISGFREGIGKILRLWTANALFPVKSLSAEIYTCIQKTHKPTNVVYNTIVDSLVRRLVAQHSLPIRFFFKDDSMGMTHDRYLQTDSVPVQFGKGFDFLNANGSLQSSTLKIDNGVYDHLQKYRSLKDSVVPLLVTP